MRLPSWLGGGLRSLREGMRYHGIWAPGVRLLQNLPFRGKAVLMVLFLLLPVSYLTVLVWSDGRARSLELERAGSALEVYGKVSAESRRFFELQRQVFHKEFGAVDAARLKAAVDAEADAHAQTEAVLTRLADADVGRELSAVMEAARTSRKAALAMISDTRGAEGGMPSPRQEAMNHHVHRLVQLSQAAVFAGRIDVLGDLTLQSLARGGLEPLPDLDSGVRHAAGIGVRVLSGGDDAGLQADRLLRALSSVSTLQSNLALYLHPAIRSGALDSAEVQATVQALHVFEGRLQQVAVEVRAGRAATGATTRDAVAPLADTTLRALQQLHDHVIESASKSLQLVVDQQGRAFREGLLVIAFGLLGSGYFMVCMNKVVGGGLRELRNRVDAMARGDLKPKPDGRGRDEVGQALTALGQSVRQMATLFEAVTQGVAAVSHASREVAHGNSGLSGRTNEIRSSISGVGDRARSFMEAMNACGEEVERAAEHMHSVRGDAQRTRKAMAALQARMEALQSKTREIRRVVGMVENVAYQTRLLSLNASVEAARAGPAGKGFGVVAQEVRELARRSEDAAQKINDIVAGSIADIDESGSLTERVGASVRSTDERIAQVNTIMSEIVQLTHAGRNQSQEVVTITREVENAADGNARLVEQLAHASGDLRQQGDNLKRSVKHFVFG